MSKWTKYHNKQTFCRCCMKKVSTKPGKLCIEPKHQWQYDENKKNIKKNRDAAQLETLIYYSGYNPPKCVLCNFDNILCLQLDHIDGSGAEFRRNNSGRSGKSLCLTLRKNNWPSGYRILCANCQYIERMRLGVYGGGKRLT